jgi:hypothetical protein
MSGRIRIDNGPSEAVPSGAVYGEPLNDRRLVASGPMDDMFNDDTPFEGGVENPESCESCT